MNTEEIILFKNSIADLSIDDLKEKRDCLREKLTKMIMDSDVIMQIAIVEAKIKEKGE